MRLLVGHLFLTFRLVTGVAPSAACSVAKGGRQQIQCLHRVTYYEDLPSALRSLFEEPALMEN